MDALRESAILSRIDHLERTVARWRLCAGTCALLICFGGLAAFSYEPVQGGDAAKVQDTLNVKELVAERVVCRNVVVTDGAVSAVSSSAPDARTTLTFMGVSTECIDKSSEWQGMSASLGMLGLAVRRVQGHERVTEIQGKSLPTPIDLPRYSNGFELTIAEGEFFAELRPSAKSQKKFTMRATPSSDGVTLTLGDAQQGLRLVSTDGGSAWLDVHDGARSGMLGSSRTDGVTLMLSDAAGRTRATLGGQPVVVSPGQPTRHLPESTLSLWDESGKCVVMLPGR